MTDIKNEEAGEKKSLNFIEQAVEKDLKEGKNGGKVQTRFPPEPNGYLHIGHAKAICLDFGIAEAHGGVCNLRFDDTNPTKEDVEYVEAIKEDIQWLGYQWGNEYYASDYFQQLWDFAIRLIQEGKAYIDEQTSEQIAQQKGTPTQPGVESPYRNRPIEESLELFKKMNSGEIEEGAMVLRAKIDMANPNMHFRDPIIYRVVKHPHHRTGTTWKAAALLFSIYIFTYGKTLDWFSSPKIRIYTIAIPILIYLFVHRQRTQEKPYVSLKPLHHHKSIIGYTFMVLVMFFSASSSLITNYLNSIIRVDSVHANSLSLVLIPGFIVGAIICFWWFRWQRWRFRYLISGGMFCYVIYLVILYFGITPYSTYEMLYFPVFLRGLGMMTLFIAFGVYVVEDLDPKLMLSNAFFLISLRSVLAPAISASFFSNLLYYLQIKGMNTLSEHMTLTNPLASSRYAQAMNSALAQGHGYDEASQLAANNFYSTLQQQSLLLGIKTVIGYLLIAALVIAVVSAFIPFHKTLKVAVVKTGDDMV